MEDNLQTLKGIFEALKAAGRIHTQTDFAELLGASKSTISSALKGNPTYLTDNLIRRAILVAREAAVPFQPSGGTPGTPQPSITIPAEVADLYKNMAESNKELSETVRTQQDTIRMLVEMIREEKGDTRKAAL